MVIFYIKSSKKLQASWPSGSERRLYDNCQRKLDGLTLAQVSLIVASLDKMLYGNYLCLVESNKQQIKEV